MADRQKRPTEILLSRHDEQFFDGTDTDGGAPLAAFNITVRFYPLKGP